MTLIALLALTMPSPTVFVIAPSTFILTLSLGINPPGSCDGTLQWMQG